MIKNNDKISENQTTILLLTTIVGAGILSLPTQVANTAGPDSLLAVLLGGLLALFFSRIIASIASKYPTETFVEYSSKLLTKPISIIISIIIILYFIIFSSVDLRIFGEVSKAYLLNNTPIEIIMITLLFTCGYIVRYGIEPIARMSEIMFPIMIIPLLIVLLPLLTDIDLSNFLPILRTNPLRFLKGVYSTMFSYVGFEILYIIFPYINIGNRFKKDINISFIFIIFLYIYITFFTIGIFGYKETKEQIWPLLTVMKSINFPGFFLENFESLIMAIWTFAVYTSIASFYYVAVLSLSKLLKAREHSYLVLPLIPIIYFLALIPDSIVQVYRYMQIVSNYIAAFFIIILPLLMLTIYAAKGGNRNENKKSK